VYVCVSVCVCVYVCVCVCECVCVRLTQFSEELHSQRSVDEEEQHEEEAQISHLESRAQVRNPLLTNGAHGARLGLFKSVTFTKMSTTTKMATELVFWCSSNGAAFRNKCVERIPTRLNQSTSCSCGSSFKHYFMCSPSIILHISWRKKKTKWNEIFWGQNEKI